MTETSNTPMGGGLTRRDVTVGSTPPRSGAEAPTMFVLTCGGPDDCEIVGVFSAGDMAEAAKAALIEQHALYCRASGRDPMWGASVREVRADSLTGLWEWSVWLDLDGKRDGENGMDIDLHYSHWGPCVMMDGDTPCGYRGAGATLEEAESSAKAGIAELSATRARAAVAGATTTGGGK